MSIDREPVRSNLPLRSELFSTDQMEQHGRTLAGLHQFGMIGSSGQLLVRLAENEEVLTAVYKLLIATIQTQRRIAPAGEWLLDNFYLIEEQIATARRHLPKGYSRELPRLISGPSTGLPRVYDIALETVSHSDGRLHMEGLASFVGAYQTVSILNLGELWAIPTMLRLALIENLRRVAAPMAAGRSDRDSADYWVNRITEVIEKDPRQLIMTMADMAGTSPPMSSSFVAEFSRRLQGKGSAFALPMTWIEQQLLGSGQTIADLVQAENQQQTADQVSISNSITSLRLLGKVDWREFVESMSIVQSILCRDPAQAYAKMDFATRDRYRHVVEDTAKRTGQAEETIATDVVEMAIAGAARHGGDERVSHVGFYLINKKRGSLPLVLYVGAIASLTATLTACLLWVAAGGLQIGLFLLIGFLTVCCSSHLAVAMVNWLSMLLVPPEQLPRMDFSKGIPADCRTLTIVPTMLVSEQQVHDLVEALEVRFLANRDENLYFGLLTDFQDSHHQKTPGDDPLLKLARTKIEHLNSKYAGGAPREPFFLFHRPRQWNSSDDVWMGHERKRGKLADLNCILRGGSTERFSLIVGPTAVLPTVRYVITLDTDTELPRGSARQMVGAMAHPLNRPRYDETAGRIVEGYGILQPRVAVSLPGTNRSRYARMFGGQSGIDPYTRAVSDVYQDLFGEGSFIGKGIYDVDAFERALHHRLPDDLILSHDLIEGCYARSGLLSDVPLYEENPSRYIVDANRRRRWIRGDWQIAQWLLARVPGYGAESKANPISALSRWKIFDNLRRSLVPAAIVFLLIVGWTVLTPSWVWTSAILAILFMPTLFASILDLLRKPDEVRLDQHLATSLHSAGLALQQAAFSFACLPHEAWFSLDAIARTTMRMLVTRKQLLEWSASNRQRNTEMWVGPAVATAVTAYLMFARRGTLVQAAPMLALWFISPMAAWWLSRPLARRAVVLTTRQVAFLKELARKTWSFFETFVGPDDHWLPPDNFQENPGPVVTHRTSPTNMGLALLANLAAHDFGYISLDQLIERTTNALDTMERLERYLGHFYNWYDTRTLQALQPLYISTVDSGNLAAHLLTLRQGLMSLSDPARGEVLAVLAHRCGRLAEMEYDFLLDTTSHLLAIGYNVSERRVDASSYDLLASEARLAAFVAIAQGRVSDESWFALGRRLTNSGGNPVLLSWSGSMFEYLMPLLVMPTYDNTLLDDTYKAAVNRQIAYGRKRHVPWGISECGYSILDAHLNYQYRAFGVPGLGFKRGLAEDLVIAPYASVLGLMVSPEEACTNLERISTSGFEGRYGMYEAIDYTPSRLPPGQSRAVIQSFMAHHQGMSFLALAYLLLDRPMQKRFEADPSFQASMLLLQERSSKATRDYLHTKESPNTVVSAPRSEARPVRVYTSPNTPIPEVQLLSNGTYHVMVTNAGGGYSRWKDIGVTRWNEDSTCDNWGTFCYVRDVASGDTWSIAHQPVLKTADEYEATFSEARVEFRRRDKGIETRTEIAVSPEDDIELRRVHLTNFSRRTRVMDFTSYAEIVLAPPAGDALHPAFSNLFVQTQILRDRQTILCTRRPRSSGEPTPWMFHLIAGHGAAAGETSYETDRARFIGRGRTVADPIAHSTQLSGTDGSVLDPIVAIRRRITLRPDETVTLNVVSGIGTNREACAALAEKYQDPRFADRVFDLTWTHSQVVLSQINATQSDAQLYGRLASSIIYASPLLRADPGILLKNQRTQSGLWGYSISGDLPIVLLRIGDPTRLDLVRQLIQAHAYWRMKGLAVDLVIWNEDQTGYRQPLHDEIIGMITAGIGANAIDRPGGILVRHAEQISSEDRILLQTVARVVISDSEGMLADQLDRRRPPESIVPGLNASRNRAIETKATAFAPRHDLIFFNGHGGFTPDGREYIITSAIDRMTPAPWVNVLANPSFGTVVSECGVANTWSENAHEFRLTPWKNDPVSDCGGEAFYIRDEDSGHFWSPTLLPRTGATPYVARHGFGYSVFEHVEDGIRSELWTYVAIDAPVKLSVIKFHNESGRPRRLSITGYVEWVLGDLRSRSRMHVITEVDSSGALFARNPYNAEFAGRIAFFDVNDADRTISGDRLEFLGRNGTLAHPAALTRMRLSGRDGPGLDSCAAIQVSFELAEDQDKEVIFTLGASRGINAARNLALRFRESAAARGALEAVWEYWNRTLGTVHVETPDPSVNVLTNGWLLYQTLACRLWARSGYYQPGGAFGFRDQLQDAMALIHAAPHLLREHLLRCAAHQFREGDVQHWWHPPSNRGVRTHCSDDYLWLPYATARYVTSTGDIGVLDETVSFIEGRQVKTDEDSYYDLPDQSETAVTLYEHCVQAILRGLQFGERGLPLIGSGDWNDGMNLIGIKGKGESVWLAFFLYDVLMKFADVAITRGDGAFAERCHGEAAQLRDNIEKNGWDGAWFRRAYFDDGTPLGSSINAECQIDSIPQSWAVLSGAGDAERQRQAMNAVSERLVRRDAALIQLLAPPFDKSLLDPGYIKGYVPGVRENGGQYTHAAIWSAMAFAALGESEKAWDLWAMINPINHGSSPEAIAAYKVEPYVMAADVYALSPHTGRGGWTWYTGSAGWMYRLITESLLGLRLDVDKLHVGPCLPAGWNSFDVDYRYRETVYHIHVSCSAPGKPQQSVIALVDDREEHWVELSIGA